MLGAVIGDIVGSVYEFNNYRAKDFQPLFSRKHGDSTRSFNGWDRVAAAETVVNVDVRF